ncbi:hypothetical protein ACVWXM_005503 [Bradyrhizobium sp. GM7.3]
MRPLVNRPRVDRDTDRAKAVELFFYRAAHIGAIVRLARRDDEIDRVDACCDSALGALRVWRQRADGCGLLRERMRHHRVDIGELRHDLWRNERPGIDLAHTGGGERVDQRAFGFGRNEDVKVLETIAGSNLANVDIGRARHRGSFWLIVYHCKGGELRVKRRSKLCQYMASG